MIDPLKAGCVCAECPFARDGRPVKPVGSEGDTSTAVGVLVGDGPGHDEVALQRPFVGQTGRVLDEELVATGLDRRKLFILNATACLPVNKSAASLAAAVKCCAPLFQRELAKVRPATPILAMGSAAVAALGIKAKIRTGRGFIRQLDKRQAIITWHPTYAFFRSPYEHGAFSVDLERFARLTRGLKYSPPPVNINPTAEDIDAIASDGSELGCDIETAPANSSEPWTGKDPSRARLKTIALASPERAVALPWFRRPPTVGVEQLQASVGRALRNPRITKVFHNGPWFDLRVLARSRIRVDGWEDTRDMRRALSATSRLSLLHLASLYTDFHPWKTDEDGEKLSTTGDIEALLRYNGWDSVVTIRAYHAMKKELDQDD